MPLGPLGLSVRYSLISGSIIFVYEGQSLPDALRMVRLDHSRIVLSGMDREPTVCLELGQRE